MDTFLSQSHCAEKLLRKFNSFDVTPAKTPYDPSVQLTKIQEASVSQEEYVKIIGSLMFFMNYTKSDIAFVVNGLSHCTHNPSGDYWNALKWVLWYLKGTMDSGLHYVDFPLSWKDIMMQTGLIIMMM